MTLIVLTYNQAAFVEAAVAAALAQTYPNLQIVISDDCSTDATPGLVRALVAKLKTRHEVVITTTPRNLGVGGNLSHAIGLARGELLIMSAGDDISKPERVSTLVVEWERAGRVCGLFSSATLIDESGSVLQDYFSITTHLVSRADETRLSKLVRLVQKNEFLALGSTAAWNPELLRFFGPLDPAITHEDTAFSFRSWLIGDIVEVRQPLVLYRTHTSNISNRISAVPITPEDYRNRERRLARWALGALPHVRQHARDVERAFERGRISADERRVLLEVIDQRLFQEEVRGRWFDSTPSIRARFLLEAVRRNDRSLVTWCTLRSAGIDAYCSTRAFLARGARLRRRLASLVTGPR